MAADDAGEKSEQPTARRLQEARDNGQVAKSMDLTAAIAMLGGMVLLQFYREGMLEAMLAMCGDLGMPIDISGGQINTWIARVANAAAKILLPFLMFLVLIVLVGSYLQSGWVLSWKKLMPDAKHLSPAKGIKRIFSKDAVTKLLMGIAKMVVVTAVAWFTIVPRIGSVLGSGNGQPGAVLKFALDLMFTVAFRLVLVLFLLGLIDYVYQRYSLAQNLKMTKQEVKEEMKRMDGDPVMKRRRREVQQQLAVQRIRNAVPKADVVVTNPTHFAVAIRYESKDMAAPKVVAKGADFLAQHIREIASTFSIPIVERPELARMLYRNVEVGQEVPERFYRAVAEVLAYVYELGRRRMGPAPVSVG
ncbi:MAG: flagellar biosynthesis protein FlhB [Planctomycetes bacterium]|nr:flagellar biosynthesis protein FlhB [Planctomycetota bacterium]